MYSGPNWFPMGDPTYSMDVHHNPYQVWNEPAPPYTEQSSNRSRQSNRDTKSRTDSRAKSGASGRSSDRTSRRDSFKSRSLPSLLNEDLYSEASTFQRKSVLNHRQVATTQFQNSQLELQLELLLSQNVRLELELLTKPAVGSPSTTRFVVCTSQNWSQTPSGPAGRPQTHRSGTTTSRGPGQGRRLASPAQLTLQRKKLSWRWDIRGWMTRVTILLWLVIFLKM